MALMGIFLRDGLVHQSYKRWELSLQNKSPEMEIMDECVIKFS